MNFLKTLGLLMVLVGYAMAASLSSIASSYDLSKLIDEDEIREEKDELDTVRKPILGGSYLISKEPTDKTGSPKRPDFDYKTEDGKSSAHDDQKTDGGHARAARSASYDVVGDHYFDTRRPGDRGSEEEISGRFRSPGKFEEETDTFE